MLQDCGKKDPFIGQFPMFTFQLFVLYYLQAGQGRDFDVSKKRLEAFSFGTQGLLHLPEGLPTHSFGYLHIVLVTYT